MQPYSNSTSAGDSSISLNTSSMMANSNNAAAAAAAAAATTAGGLAPMVIGSEEASRLSTRELNDMLFSDSTDAAGHRDELFALSPPPLLRTGSQSSGLQ
jgi:hypothetical protein